MIRSNGDSQTYNVASNVERQPSDETCKMARERYSHITTTLKRPKVEQTKEPEKDLGEQTSIWEYLARAEGAVEVKPSFEI